MHARLAQDLAELDPLLEQLRRHALEALTSLDARPAALAPTTRAPSALPLQGKGMAGALERFAQDWQPGFSGSAGPRYFGFVTGGATPAGLAGDWLTSTLDQNPTAGIDSAAPDLERETLGWLRELFGLSAAQVGIFVSGATMSNVVGLAVAREWLGEQRGIRISEDGVAALGAVTILSGAAHSSVYKAASMLGLGRRSLHRLPLLAGREAVDVAALESALIAAGDPPVIVVANAGTVNTVDFDDLAAIAALKQRHRFWLHVDAAFGAFAALSPPHAPLVAALDAADSVCIDLHKWLNVPYDSAVAYTRRPDLQLRVFQNAAAYLGAPGERPDFVHLTPENSRRLRALASWFSLSAYGRDGHAEIVQRNIRLAQRLGQCIETIPQLHCIAPVRLNVVCFSLRDDPSEARVQRFVQAVRDSGEVFVTPTVLDGQWAVRAAFSNWRTSEADVERAAAALAAAAAALGAL